MVLYPSDKLFYPIAQKYSTSPELIFISNNQIVLGAQVFIDRSLGYRYEDEMDQAEEENQLTINIEALSVVREDLNKELFKVPPGFSKYQRDIYQDSIMMFDSIAMAIDTVSMNETDTSKISGEHRIMEEKPIPLAPPPPPVLKKGEAIKRKKN